MIEKVKKLRILEFLKDFDTDLLELIYERYYDTLCEVKMYYNSYFDFLEIKINKLIVGEIEHVAIKYDDFSRYNKLTVDEILTAIYDKAFNEFQSLREISLGIQDDYISDYILQGKGVLGNDE